MDEGIARRQRRVLAALLGALGPLLFVKCFWTPAGLKIARLREELTEVERELQRKKERALRLATMEKESVSLKPTQQKIAGRNPKGPVPSAVIDALADEARRHNVLLTQIALLERASVKQFHLQSTYEAVAYARSADLERFLWTASRDREHAVLRVEALRLEPAGRDGRRRASLRFCAIRWRS